MLRVVAICAVALGCHLIAAADVDLPIEDIVTNETFVEERTTLQPEREPRVENEEVDQKEPSFCSPPPNIEGVISPDLDRDEYPLGTVISYKCEFGYVSRSSGTFLSTCRTDISTGKAEWTHPNTTCIPRSCGDPGYVVNGRRIGNLFTFPNSVTFECLEGYKIEGLKDRYCQASGEWSGRLPTCVSIRCPIPSSPQNGKVRYSSLEYGSELQYECDKGFMLQNYQPRICNGDGIWSNNEPECIEKSCRTPEAPEHGFVQLSDKPKAGTLAFFTCDDGTTLVGASTSKCLISGDWTFDTPKCLRSCYVPRIQDGALGHFQLRSKNTRVFISVKVGESVKHQDEVTLRCKEGYSPGNQNGRTQEVQCNDGTWSEQLYCQQMECTEEPPSTENASPRIGSRAHGSFIWYQCDPGYEKTASGKVVCKYGKWEGSTPVCTDYRCYMKDLDYPGLLKPNVNFIFSEQHFNLACDKAHEVSYTEKKITCSRGRWGVTGNPCTLKICKEEPPSIDNGIPKRFDRTNGSFVDYECEEGYEMVGQSSVHCVFGTWVGQPPDCRLSTKNLPVSSLESSNNVRIGSPLSTSFTLVEPEECFCTYNFQRDYLKVLWRNAELMSSYIRIKFGDNVLLECRYPNMDIVWPNGLRIYERMRMICDRCHQWNVQELPYCDYRHEGDSFIIYNEQMKFRPGGAIEVPHSARISLGCINQVTRPVWNFAKKLSFPDYPRHARQISFFRNDVIINKIDNENVGRYECYGVIHNQKQRSAVVDLEIHGFGVSCPELLTETSQGSFEIVYSNGRKVGSIAHFTCKDSLKRIVGPSKITCQENGIWSHSSVACEDIRCPALNENNIFVITYNNNGKVNSLAFYNCRTTRQRLIGSSNRTCLHSGEWSGTNPQCEDITCPGFRTYNGLSVTYSRGIKVGSIASFSCLNHTTLVGNPDASCLHNGTWSHPRPSCEMLEMSCPKLDGKGIFSIKYSNNRRVNSTAIFFCKGPKQKVAGCNFMTCQENGEWSGDFPTCVDSVSCDLFPDLPNLNVRYTDGGRVGSVASFQCLHATSLVGSAAAKCLSNGTWSHSLPICAAPNCSIEDFDKFLEQKKLDALHANLINITSDWLTPGSELPLICEKNSVLSGSSKAVCNSLGEWDIKDAQCIAACLVNKDETSLLIVEPLKDYYNFAEFILLSCPPGQKLTREVQRIICLGSKWSDPLPDCIEMTEPNILKVSEITTKSD